MSARTIRAASIVVVMGFALAGSAPGENKKEPSYDGLYLSTWARRLKDGYTPQSRRHAAEAIGKIGPTAKEAVPTLIEALKDEDARVRIAVTGALARSEARKSSRG
jgi:hypothetical protein